MNLGEDINQARELSVTIQQLLKGKPNFVQASVLADLLSLWLAAHIDLDSEKNTHRHRESLLSMHIAVVEKLVPESVKELRLPW